MKRNGEYIGIDDDYIPENEKYVDESLLGDKEESSRKIKKTAKAIGIGYIVFISFFVVMFFGILIYGFSTMSGIKKGFNNTYSKITTNSLFEQYEGTTTFAKSALDNVITNNKTNKDHIITVIYKGITATEENEIISIKNLLTNFEYDFSLGYDSNGCINSITIKDIEKVQTASSFNSTIKRIEGHYYGANRLLDDVISSNKTNKDHIITVIYKETSAITEDEILALEKLLDKRTEYYYSLDYDSNGFINKITIKDL